MNDQDRVAASWPHRPGPTVEGAGERLASPFRHLTHRQIDLACAAGLGIGAFALYAATAVPGVLTGDPGEFQYMPRLLGIPHPSGYPLYLLLGWLWSWLPLGTLASRMNIFSAVWAGLALALLYLVARQQGLRRMAALSGSVALGLVSPFWRYAGQASVYTLNIALLTAAVGAWLYWPAAPPRTAKKWLWGAAFLTGLALTNHPTAALLIPAAILFVFLQAIRSSLRGRRPHSETEAPATGSPALWRELVAACGFFVLPGLLYLYVPLRLWAIGPGIERFGLKESVAKGWVSALVDRTPEGVLRYIVGLDFLGNYHSAWGLFWTRLPALLVEHLGVPLVVLGGVGALSWLVRRRASGVSLLAFFLSAAFAAVAYDASYAARNEVVHSAAHMLPALLVYAFWIAEGADAGFRLAQRLLKRTWLVYGVAGPLLVLAFSSHFAGADLPTATDRMDSLSIQDYWREILSYPLESESAVTAHWGDLTPFWYLQNSGGGGAGPICGRSTHQTCSSWRLGSNRAAARSTSQAPCWVGVLSWRMYTT